MELGEETPLLKERPQLPIYLVPYERAFSRLCQGGLEDGFSMSDVKIAYELFPIGSAEFFFDAMYAMRSSLHAEIMKERKNG